MTRWGHIAHPLTGVTLDRDDPVQLAQAMVDTEDWWSTMKAAYRARWEMYNQVRERLAEIRPAAPLPRPTRQTDKQRATRRCPRCRTWYDEREAA